MWWPYAIAAAAAAAYLVRPRDKYKVPVRQSWTLRALNAAAVAELLTARLLRHKRPARGQDAALAAVVATTDGRGRTTHETHRLGAGRVASGAV